MAERPMQFDPKAEAAMMSYSSAPSRALLQVLSEATEPMTRSALKDRTEDLIGKREYPNTLLNDALIKMEQAELIEDQKLPGAPDALASLMPNRSSGYVISERGRKVMEILEAAYQQISQL